MTVRCKHEHQNWEIAAETTNNFIGKKLSHHNFQISNVDHLEKFFSKVRQKLSRDEMLDINVNAVIWRISVSATMKLTVHLGQITMRISVQQHTDFEKIKTLCDISQKLILNHD